MTPTSVLTFNDMNARAVEFKRVGTATTVTITPKQSELWMIYAIQDSDGSTNVWQVNYTPGVAGAGTYVPFKQTAASAVSVGTPSMPPIRYGDTVTISGSVAANYLVMYQAVPLP